MIIVQTKLSQEIKDKYKIVNNSFRSDKIKILIAVLVHDKRIYTVKKTLDSLKEIDNVEIFCYNTEKICIENLKNYKLNIYKRPKIDIDKLTHEEYMIGAGLPESQISYIAWLRNKALEKAKEKKYDYLFFVDSDLIVPKNAIEKLIEVRTDVALGWYFNKRLTCVDLLIYGSPNIDEVMLSEEIQDAYQGGGSGMLISKDVIQNIRFPLYNGYEGEPRGFCRNVIRAGYKIKANPKVYFEHIGEDYTEEGKKYAEQKIKEWNL